MRLDLIVVKNRTRDKIIKSVIIFSTLIIVILLIFLTSNFINKDKIEIELSSASQDVTNSNNIKKTKIQRKISFLPDYTDIGKEKMNNIYKSQKKQLI